MTKTWMLGLGLPACLAAPASAEENPFGYSYTAATEEPGETEVALWATDRRVKDADRYDAQDYRLEAERGLDERFQLAASLNFGSRHIRRFDPAHDDVHRNFAFDGASIEFKYRLLDEERNGIGLAVYAEPGWSRFQDEGGKDAEYELELKTILSKSFAGGRVIWAGNLTFEPEWERELKLSSSGPAEHDWEKELKLEATTGLAYRVASRWYAGVEARYAGIYPHWTHGLHPEAYAVSAGPTIAFSAHEWSASLTYLPQLFGGPSPRGRRSLDEFEKREIRLKVSHEF